MEAYWYLRNLSNLGYSYWNQSTRFHLHMLQISRQVSYIDHIMPFVQSSFLLNKSFFSVLPIIQKYQPESIDRPHPSSLSSVRHLRFPLTAEFQRFYQSQTVQQSEVRQNSRSLRRSPHIPVHSNSPPKSLRSSHNTNPTALSSTYYHPAALRHARWDPQD